MLLTNNLFTEVTPWVSNNFFSSSSASSSSASRSSSYPGLRGNQKKANSDALVNDAVRIASDAQAWNLKPAAFGGGAGEFTDISFEQLGYETSNGIYKNLNGKFQLSGVAAGTVTITGCDEQANFDNMVVA